MRVYHYLEARWALDDIRQRRLKLSTIDDMNDPFEWACVRSSDPFSQTCLKATKAHIVNMHGPLCFSHCYQSILMWSHYGDRHRGICLGFDVPDSEGKHWEAQYLEEMVVAPDLNRLSRAQQKPFMELLYSGKYIGWQYEREVRVYGSRAEQDKETGYYFVNFDEDLKLREVIGGARFPLSREPIDDALNGLQDVAVAKLRVSEERFELVFDESWPSAR
jgi:hypothetical protein